MMASGVADDKGLGHLYCGEECKILDAEAREKLKLVCNLKFLCRGLASSNSLYQQSKRLQEALLAQQQSTPESNLQQHEHPGNPIRN